MRWYCCNMDYSMRWCAGFVRLVKFALRKSSIEESGICTFVAVFEMHFSGVMTVQWSK